MFAESQDIIVPFGDKTKFDLAACALHAASKQARNAGTRFCRRSPKSSSDSMISLSF